MLATKNARHQLIRQLILIGTACRMAAFRGQLAAVTTQRNSRCRRLWTILPRGIPQRHRLVHHIPPDRQSQFAPIALIHNRPSPIQTHPYRRGQPRGVARKPGIPIIVRRPRLPSSRFLESILRSQNRCRPLIHHLSQHPSNHLRNSRTECVHLHHTRPKNDLPSFVDNLIDQIRPLPQSVIGKRRVSRCHLIRIARHVANEHLRRALLSPRQTHRSQGRHHPIQPRMIPHPNRHRIATLHQS